MGRGMSSYVDFLDHKSHSASSAGVPASFMPPQAFDFQQHLIEWALHKGRAALFTDCGTGKTLMELVWAENVARAADKPVLILTPLAVAAQTVREGEKFGIECRRSSDGSGVDGCRVVVTNYERLNHFRADDFSGVVCDESSILKSFDGSRRLEISEFMKKTPYRLLATATAAPNDYVELGTSSEALGYLGHMDMLNRFFKNDANNSATKRMYGEAPEWRFKGHAELAFWRWVASWARACRKPSDLGFDDGRLTLPPLIENTHLIETREAPSGMLFAVPGRNLAEQRDERKRTVTDRCEKVAQLADTGKQVLAWCHMNSEGDTLEQMIPDSVQISGADSDEKKERTFLDFAEGNIRVLVTKPKIGAWGLNFQKCNHVTYFPSHSYEQYYQSIRRCWRYGQTSPVTVDIVMTEGDRRVMENLQRKNEAASVMFANLVSEMNRGASVDRKRDYTQKEELPSWL